jgi:hypothetical protein
MCDQFYQLKQFYAHAIFNVYVGSQHLPHNRSTFVGESKECNLKQVCSLQTAIMASYLYSHFTYCVLFVFSGGTGNQRGYD